MGNTGRRIVAIALAVFLVVSAACSGDDDDSTTVITDPVETTETSETTTSSTTSTTVDPDAEVKAEVETAYLAYLDMVLEVMATPSPEDPRIRQHATAGVAQALAEAATTHVLDGTSVRLPPDEQDWDPRILETHLVDDQTAELQICHIDGGQIVENDSGEVLNDTVATYLRVVTMAYEDDVWKVAYSEAIERREGRWSCDA